jgi:hypothetical protein
MVYAIVIGLVVAAIAAFFLLKRKGGDTGEAGVPPVPVEPTPEPVPEPEPTPEQPTDPETGPKNIAILMPKDDDDKPTNIMWFM